MVRPSIDPSAAELSARPHVRAGGELVSLPRPGDPLRAARCWPREFTSAEVLAAEQAVLTRRTWQLLAMTSDIPEHGDWVRTTLFGRSVFVQRFRTEIVAFENVCAHRFYPLRTEDRGSGPIRCGFHGWLYNKAGEAVGVPKCQEFYGCEPRALGRRLAPVEVALVGGCIFGRLPGETADEPVDRYLGATLTPISAMTAAFRHPIGSFTQRISANWKAAYHLTLDDYHIVATHPDTFGAYGAVEEGWYRYFDLGRHSALFVDHAGVAPDAFRVFSTDCARGEVPHNAYRICQIFPNLTVFLVSLGCGWVLGIGDYQPVSPIETIGRMWIYGAMSERDPAADEQALAFLRQVVEEDRIAAERLQQGVTQMWREPALSSQEQRIAWFDAVYDDHMRSA